jgi:hypothetical protein
MASTETPHVNEDGRVYTLADGDNYWPTLLAAQGPAGLALGHAEFGFIIETGGPVAWVTKNGAVAAITEGHQYNVGEGDQRTASLGKIVDGSLQHFFSSGVSTVFIRAGNR